MSRHRSSIPQRIPFFVGCEGESEQSYVRLIGNLAAAEGASIHLEAVLLRPGGGDPCALVQLARRKLSEKRQKRGPFRAHYILLDDDLIGRAPQRDQRAQVIANEAGMRFIWQSTCHEALLLRHLDGCAALRPMTTALAKAALLQRWPDYQQGISAVELAKRIDTAAVRRAAGVESELAQFLGTIGFPL